MNLRHENTLPEADRSPLDEPLFEEAFDSAPHGLALVTVRGSIVRANRSLCQMLGFTRGELQALSCVHITHPEDYPTESEQRRRLASADIGRYELVLRYVRKSGDSIWAKLAASATLRKATENGYLVMAVEPAASPMKAARRHGDEQLLRQFGDAALAAAHEIGNTLTPLMLNAEMLLEQTTRRDVRDSAQQVFKAARRIAFALRRMRSVDDSPKVAYVGEDRMLDLRLVAPPE